MAIDLTLKSVAITNREATPKVLNDVGSGGAGIVREVSNYIASVTASLSVTSIIRLVEVPSNCRISSIKLFSGAQTAGAFDIGLCRTNADGGAIVDQDLFGSAVSCASAVAGTDVILESGQTTIAEMHQPLWQWAGATSDPKCMYDIVAVVTTTDVTTGAAPLGVKVQYVV
jgi:hypothetical protein